MSSDPRQQLENPDAERAVCGSILVDPDALLKLAGTLSPADFTNDRARWVYDSALTLYEQQQPIDQLTLATELENNGHLVEVGGVAYLTELQLATPTALHADAYAETLVRLSTRRALVEMAGKIAQLAYGANGHSNATVIEQVRALMDAVTPAVSDDETLLWLDSLERFVLAQLARNKENANRDEGQARMRLRLPWRALDRFKLRLRRGTLLMVVAGSGVGKTSFMECCAEDWAQKGYHVAYFHLELSHQRMLDRRTARLTGLPIEEIEDDGVLNERTEAAYKKMYGYSGGITYERCPGQSARQIAAKARQLHARGLCDVLIVDYLQKARLWIRRGEKTHTGLADAVEVWKNCCEHLEIGGLVGSQTNNESEHAARVTQVHARGSGEIGQKSNGVITLRRDILNDPIHDVEGNVLHEAGELSPVIAGRVDKNTMGRTGDFKLAIKGERFLITDVHY